MSAHTKRGRSLTRAERAKKYGTKWRNRGAPALHVRAMLGGDPGATRRFAGRYRTARVAAFQGRQRAKRAARAK